MPSFGRACCFLLAWPLFASCGVPAGPGHDIEAVEVLCFNGWNETWAYRMDSVGQVQALHLNVATRDSAGYCFTLSAPQRRHLLTLAQQVVRLRPLGRSKIKIAIADGPITKVVVHRTGQPFFSYTDKLVSRAYADPENVLFQLAQALREADESHRKPPCAGAFSAPVLAQGQQDLFHFPRADTLSADATQD